MPLEWLLLLEMSPFHVILLNTCNLSARAFSSSVQPTLRHVRVSSFGRRPGTLQHFLANVATWAGTGGTCLVAD